MSFTGENYPGAKAPTEESAGFRLNHTMLRIKNPEKSLASHHCFRSFLHRSHGYTERASR